MNADELPDPERKTPGGWSLRPILDLAHGLPPLPRFIIAFVALLLAGYWIPHDLRPLLYLLGGGYLVYEFVCLFRATPHVPQEPPAVAAAPSIAVKPAAPAKPEPPPRTPEEWRRAYCRSVWRRCNRLQLHTIDPKAVSHPEAAELELCAVYTSLDVQGAIVDELESPDQKSSERMAEMREERSGRHPATAIVCLNDRLVLLGDPGSGKSTLAHFLAACLAGDWLDGDAAGASSKLLGEAWTLPRLLPLPVVLREYAAEGLAKNRGLWDFLCDQLKTSSTDGNDLSPFIPHLEKMLKHGHGDGDGGLLILDGLDEVPEAGQTRERLRDQVLAFRDRFPRCRVLVTARPYAYQDDRWRLPGFTVRRLADFSDEQIETFIARWYAHVASKDAALSPADAARYTAQLQAAVKNLPRLRELAGRPLLLTLMASLHRWRGGGALPERRQELYEESVKLLIDLWQKPKQTFDAAGRPAGTEFDVFRELGLPQENLRRALEQVAFDAHLGQQKPEGAANIGIGDLAKALMEAAPSADREKLNVARVTAYVTDRAGLLIERVPREQYAFPHRTFQEYLAACKLTDAGFPRELAKLLRKDDARWREAALLAAAKAAAGTASSIWNLVDAFCPVEEKGSRKKLDDADFLLALRAAQALIETDLHRDPPEDERDVYERLRLRIERIVAEGLLSPPDRAAAGRALATLGDRRPGVGCRDGLPDILWQHIPGGTLHMGEGKNVCEVPIAPFQLAAYPVTVAQFRPFVLGDGYTNDAYWTKAGWKWKGKQLQPAWWDDSRFNSDNQPVVGVAWYEAVAYCRWLNAQLVGRMPTTVQENRTDEGIHPTIRLPTEAEWEWAARGPNAWEYPWGNGWFEDACNTDESKINATSAVGMFPAGVAKWLAEQDQPVFDLAGNVWEWCSTQGRESYTEPAVEQLEGDRPRVLRGGSWNSGPRGARSANRSGLTAGLRDDIIGFRFARTP